MEYHKYTDEEKHAFENTPGALIDLRKATEKAMSTVFPLMINGSATQEAAKQYMREHMTTKLKNPELISQLVPDFSVGCRRLTVCRPCRTLHDWMLITTPAWHQLS